MTELSRPRWLPEAWRHNFMCIAHDRFIHTADRVHDDGTWHQCQWRHNDPDNIALARDIIAASDAEYSP